MRSRKELIYLNIKQLTQEEIEELGNMELNSCDNCGEIELSELLYWIDGEYFWDIKELDEARKKGHVALCEDCYKNHLVKNLQETPDS